MEQQSISSFEHPPFSFSSNFFTYQLDFSLFSPLNLLKRCLKSFWQPLQETGRGEKKRKKTRMRAPSNVNTINWFISFFRERERKIFCGRFYGKWLKIFQLEVKILLQVSTHLVHFDLPFIEFSGKFQAPPVVLALSFIYSEPKSTTSIWLFITKLNLSSTNRVPQFTLILLMQQFRLCRKNAIGLKIPHMVSQSKFLKT